jgi:hypothetical protein
MSADVYFNNPFSAHNYNADHPVGSLILASILSANSLKMASNNSSFY